MSFVCTVSLFFDVCPGHDVGLRVSLPWILKVRLWGTAGIGV